MRTRAHTHVQIALEEVYNEKDLDALAASRSDVMGVQSRALALALVVWGRIGELVLSWCLLSLLLCAIGCSTSF